MKSYCIMILTMAMYCGSAYASAYKAPTITSIYPTLGPVGQWVYVHGTNFRSDETTVSVGGVTGITAHVYADVQLAFTVPSGATGTTHIAVTTTKGSATSAVTYTVGSPTNSPTVSSISPTLGPVGQWVYVHGNNFIVGQTQVSMGGISNIHGAVYGPDQLGFTVPDGASGITHISVSTPYGDAVSHQRFQVGIPTNAPTISHVNEYHGFNWVYVSGDNYVYGQTTVQVGEAYETVGHVYGPSSLGFNPPSNWYDETILFVETPFGVATQQLQTASPPVRLVRRTNRGRRYQVQTTRDLKGKWSDIGEPIMVEEDELQRVLRSRSTMQFWRAIEVD